MEIELVKNTDAKRYELWADGRLASLVDYRERDGAIDMPHTETRDGFGGQGLAAQVVKFALDDVATTDDKVRPLCPFVAHFIDENAEYQHLIAS